MTVIVEGALGPRHIVANLAVNCLCKSDNVFICTDQRKEIEKLIVQNGGRYSADLTKKCTHLVSDISSITLIYSTHPENFMASLQTALSTLFHVMFLICYYQF